MPRDRRHSPSPTGPGRVAHWLPTLLVLALVAAAFASYRLGLGPRYLPWLSVDPVAEPAAIAPPAGVALPEWAVPAPVSAVVPPAERGHVDPAAVAAALAPGLRDKDLGRHVVAAVGDLSGDGPAWTYGEGAVIPASTTKLLTSTAALELLGPDARFETRVLRGATRRDLVLVGGGDPYLASRPLTPEEAESTYPERADIVTLARDVAATLAPGQRVRVQYDDGLFTGPSDNPRWRADYVPDDIVSPITALWVDRGASPTGYGYSDDPSATAAETFAAALRDAGVRVVGGPVPTAAPSGATEVAGVSSAPVGDIVEHLLEVSDNEAAEVLARHVGLAVSGRGSFEGGSAGVMETLRGLGIDTGADVIHDGSGLSRLNRVSSTTLLQVLQTAAAPAHPELRSVLTGLPVAGFTGSLAYRFDTGAPEGPGRVRAKTGTLSNVHSLAGVTTDREGTAMAFVVAVDRAREEDKLDAQQAVDHLAADLAACRCSAG
ncbi:D-alanyl-D-alanine carboxypeptidase/D-alanyl-D-alanine endopeptidase [Nocardioides sp. P5_C9_2]